LGKQNFIFRPKKENLKTPKTSKVCGQIRELAKRRKEKGPDGRIEASGLLR